MVDILSVVLQRFGSQLHAVSDIKLSCEPESGTLVVGDENISRSLLLLTAITASEMGYRVLFFTQSQIQSLPVTVQDSSSFLKPEILKKIRFVYSKTLEDLLEDIASLHELMTESAPLPSLLIVDGVERYVCGHDGVLRDAPSTAAHIVALLHDTAAFLKTKSETSQQPSCRIIVSYQLEWERQNGDVFASDSIHVVLERYLPVRCSLHSVTDIRGVQNEWLLYLSGQGLQVDGYDNSLQWRVIMQSSGALEFRSEGSAKEESPQIQHPEYGN